MAKLVKEHWRKVKKKNGTTKKVRVRSSSSVKMPKKKRSANAPYNADWGDK